MERLHVSGLSQLLAAHYRTHNVMCNSHNIGMSDLPGMHAQGLRAYILGMGETNTKISMLIRYVLDT